MGQSILALRCEGTLVDHIEAMGASRPVIEGMAEQVARTISYSPTMSIGEFAGRCGAHLFVRDDANCPDVAAMFHSDARFDIFLSPQVARDTGRYAVAEEIGHFVLHYREVTANRRPVAPVYIRNSAKPELARAEAIWFASAFLMPADLLEDFCRTRTRTVTQVADAFDVSPTTAQNRLRRLRWLAADGVTTVQSASLEEPQLVVPA